MFQDIPLDSSEDDTDSEWEHIDPQYSIPQPPEEPHHSTYNAPAVASPEGDENESIPDELAPRRKPGGYDSRIEQILYENPELPILITDAGKSVESGGRYIVYTIRTGVSSAGTQAMFVCTDEVLRISRSADDTLSSPPCVMPSADSILPSSSHRFPRNTPWQTTRPTRRTRSKTSRLSTCASACSQFF